jgi:methylamine---corrinoid protein Co-methyltransferase
MRSNWLPEIVKRSESGPFMKESAFDMALTRKVIELVKAYDLKFDPQVVVPADDDLADRVYQAGFELFVEMGVYNQSTERVIEFSREEVEAGVAAAHNAVTLGMGKDAVVMGHLQVEGDTPCVVHSGPTGTPSSERYHPLILEACAMEPLVDCLGAGSVSTYHGMPVIPGTAMEILAARRDAEIARNAIRKVGRPGMHINDVAVPLTCAGKMAAFDPQTGLRPCDSMLITQIPELKTHHDQLSRVAFQRSVDMHIVNLMTPLIGGLGGGAEGTAIVNIASHLLGAICYDASYTDMGHMSLRWSHNTGRMGLWIYAVAGQTLARNTPLVTSNAIYTRNGPPTDEMLWEVAASAVTCTVSAVHQMGIGATGGAYEDRTTGLENRFNAEVAHAALGMSRADANEFALQCLEKYEHTHTDPDPGKPFAEVYDLENLEPGEEWLGAYQRVRSEIIAMGLDLDGAWKRVRRDI